MTASTSDPIDLTLPIWRDDPNQLHAALMDQLATKVAVSADLPRPADTLTVQMLLAARNAAASRKVPFVVLDASDAFRAGLQTLGLHDDILAEGAPA